ncbi:MAG: hypothetical protein GXO87_00605 [Chlorobi bacterium]|nr:hypothetical protein [Chlorobiota bacterium]
MANNNIKKELLNLYLLKLLPALFLIGVLYLVKYFGYGFGIQVSKIAAIAVASFAALFSVGLPVFYRTWFVNKVKNLKSVPTNDFIAFEKNTISIALVSPYLLFVSLFLDVDQIYIIIVAFLSIYSAYYFFPSANKIRFEKKLFRINKNTANENG